MKFTLSLLAFAVILSSLPACTTLVNRRDMYRPREGSGPYTTQYAPNRANEGLFGVSQDEHYPRTEHEGIFGISNSDERYYESTAGRHEGIFGISHNTRYP